ncbi:MULTISPECIES: MFS transporter [unclassified Dyella]|uniref:NTP/NDP exchange transporter n=1 Tax=unclassified Dyella TaxID=2634549 RepID=UPI001E61BC5C|nr:MULTISPECIES: MFS transporter [unclassified Dyella]MDR3444368.1 MFS transporter [Dyella sp.]
MNTPRSAAANESRTLLLATVAFFFVLLAYYIVRALREELVGAVGSKELPLIYGITLVVMLLLTPAFGALVARFPRKRLIGYSYSFFIACFIAFVPAFVMQDHIGARVLGLVFYVWLSVFNLFVVSLFWSLMADIFQNEQAKRVFSIIALGGMGGAICGPGLGKVLLGVVGVPPLLIISAAALAVALGLLLTLSTHHDHRAPGTQEEVIGGSLWAGAKELWTRPFLRYMAVLMVLGDGIGTLAYALMADYTNAHYTDRVARTDFYFNLDLATNSLGILLQLTVTRWLLMRKGAGWALVVASLVNLLLLLLVAMMGVGKVGIFGLVEVPMLAVMMVGSRGFAYGMTKPATDSLYTRVPRETRYKGKNFVETAIWRFGDLIVTSGVRLLGAMGVAATGMAAIGAGVSVCAAWISARAANSPDLLPDPKPIDGTGLRQADAADA